MWLCVYHSVWMCVFVYLVCVCVCRYRCVAWPFLRILVSLSPRTTSHANRCHNELQLVKSALFSCMFFFENGGKEGMLTINYVAIRIRLIKIRALVELDSSADTNYKIFFSSHLFLLKIPPSQHRGNSQQFSPCHPQHLSKEALDLLNILSVWTLILSRLCTFMSIV